MHWRLRMWGQYDLASRVAEAWCVGAGVKCARVRVQTYPRPPPTTTTTDSSWLLESAHLQGI